MIKFVEFFCGYYDVIIGVVFTVLAFIISLVTFFRTGSVKKSISNFLEVNNLSKKYITVDSRPSSDTFAQSFSEYQKDYILNSVTNELEELPVPKNVQEYIQSFLETSLEHAFEKYLPTNVEDRDDVVDYDRAVTDLASLGEAMEVCEFYREKFNLSPTLSMAQVYDYVDKLSATIKESDKPVVVNGDKEVE